MKKDVRLKRIVQEGGTEVTLLYHIKQEIGEGIVNKFHNWKIIHPNF
jgi:hypothetical protein